ncbi:hypothetical protein Hanom_Chr02g00129251 [Helianthus anomalus]
MLVVIFFFFVKEDNTPGKILLRKCYVHLNGKGPNKMGKHPAPPPNLNNPTKTPKNPTIHLNKETTN